MYTFFISNALAIEELVTKKYVQEGWSTLELHCVSTAKKSILTIALMTVYSKVVLALLLMQRKSQYLFSIWSVGLTRSHFPVQNIAYASAAYLHIQQLRIKY